MLQPPGMGMAILLGAIIALGNVFTLIAVHGSATGRYGRYSGFIGVRTAATRASEETWAAAHRAAWPFTLALNGGALLAGVAIAALGMTVTPFLVALGLSVVLMVAAAVTQIVVGQRAAKRVLAGEAN